MNLTERESVHLMKLYLAAVDDLELYKRMYQAKCAELDKLLQPIEDGVNETPFATVEGGTDE